jgi:hypothetical protein
MSPLLLIRKIAVWGCSQGKSSNCSKQYYARYKQFSTRLRFAFVFYLIYQSLNLITWVNDPFSFCSITSCNSWGTIS